MPISYEIFFNNLPGETKTFLKTLLNYLTTSYSIEFYNFRIIDDTDLLFFKALKAYRESSEENNNFLNYLGYDFDAKIPFYDPTRISAKDRGEAFSRYYDYIVPDAPEEEYLALTPEEIIKNIFNHATYYSFDKYHTISKIPDGKNKFLAKLLEVGTAKKENYLKYYTETFNKEFPISVINYYDMVGKVYDYLREHKDEIKNVEVSEDGLENLAMVIALFYYKHVSVLQDTYNEKQITIDFLEKNGFTINKLKDKIGLSFSANDMKKRQNPILILSKYFYKILKKENGEVCDSISDITLRLFKGKVGNSLYIKKILSLFDLTMSGMAPLEKEYQKKKAIAVIDEDKLEDIYKDLMPSVICFLKRIAKIYTYLTNNQEALNKEYVVNEYDKRNLAIFLTTYDLSNNFKNFLEDHGLTLDKVLSLLDLPEKESYLKELNATEANELSLVNFRDILFKRISDTPKSKIDVMSILSNICYRQYTNSNLIYRLYNTVTDEYLPDPFVKTVNEYIDGKTEQRKQQEAEEMLKDVSIDVYKFLTILCGYYNIFKDKNLSPVDLEQLSIIFAASRSDDRLEKYLDNLGMNRSNMADAFGIQFSYHSAPLDIDIIKNHFKKYIFDRPAESITVYSIFENAFKKELINSLRLRKGLSKFNKEPEDFLGIQKTLDEIERNEKAQKENARINELFDRCTEEAREVIENALRIHKYVHLNLYKKNPLIKTVDDVKELSLLIAILQHDDKYNQLFEHNGIYLEKTLASIGLTKKGLDEILSRDFNKRLIALYLEYLKNNQVDLKTLVNALLNDGVNKSRVLETLTEDTGNYYDYLKEELETEKERDLTPEQGIEVLEKEEVTAITNPSFSSFAAYGQGLSKHSKYINESLQDLISNDSISESLTSINELLSEVSYEEEISTPVKRTSFFDKLFALDPPKQVVTKYDQKKLVELGDEVDRYVEVLSKELKGYDTTRRYIETYLKLLQSQLHYLEMYSASLETEIQPEPSNEMDRIFQNYNRRAFKNTVADKIKNTRTTRDLMLQNLSIVYNSIITHLNTIYALDACKNAVIPSLATHLAISEGNKTEKEALEFTNGLVKLLGGLVNNNVETIRENLERLETTAMRPEEYMGIKNAVSSYLDKVEEKEALPQAQTTDPILEALKKGKGLPPIRDNYEDENNHGMIFRG